MDILITVGIFPPDIGGPASFVPKISKYLISKGHKVKIISLSEKPLLDSNTRSASSKSPKVSFITFSINSF